METITSIKNNKYFSHSGQFLRPLLKIIGGKTKTRDRIYAVRPKYYTEYVEPFGGSFAVLMGAPKVERETINDSNTDIVSFYQVVRDNPELLYEQVQYHVGALKKWGKEYFEYLRDHPSQISKVDKAVWTYCINKSCFNGILRYRKDGSCNSSFCKDVINRGWMDVEWLYLVSQRLQEVNIYDWDFRELLRFWEVGNDEHTWIFLDPPYFLRSAEFPDGTVTTYNGKEFTLKDHEDLRDFLHKTTAKWTLTINDCQWTREAYGDFRIIDNPIAYSCSQTPKGRGITNELLICNYDV